MHAVSEVKIGRKPKKTVQESQTENNQQKEKSSIETESVTDEECIINSFINQSITFDGSPENVGRENQKVAGSSSGIPKGSENKRTLKNEKLLAEGKLKLPEKGKYGRPKGSRNRPEYQTSGNVVKRKSSCPKGSKNKPVHLLGNSILGYHLSFIRVLTEFIWKRSRIYIRKYYGEPKKSLM